MRFVARRFGMYVIAAWAAMTLNFVLPRTMPGDPATTLFASMRGQMNPQELSSLKKAYGLTDAPLWQQYLTYIGQVFHGNFGISLSHFPTPVTTVIGEALIWTLLLGLTSLALSCVIGTALGTLAAWRRSGIVDSLLPPLLMFIGSFPYFFLALLVLYVMGLVLNWFPHGNAFGPTVNPGFNLSFILSVLFHLILPAGTIVLVAVGGWLIGMRNTMVGVLSEDYLLVAEAKGLSQTRRMIRYAARNALLPTVTSFGLNLGFIFSGQLLTEIVFSWPGLGYQLLQAVTGQDYPLLQALFLIITISVLIANLIVDVVYVWLDPRARAA